MRSHLYGDGVVAPSVCIILHVPAAAQRPRIASVDVRRRNTNTRARIPIV
jgi:hypothetical protein